MEKASNYGSSNLIVTFHIYLAILVIAISTALVFKFCDHIPVNSAKEVRDFTIKLTLHQQPRLETVLREKRENLFYVFSVLGSTAIVFLSLFLCNKYVSAFSRRSEKFLDFIAIIFSLTSIVFAAKYQHSKCFYDDDVGPDNSKSDYLF